MISSRHQHGFAKDPGQGGRPGIQLAAIMLLCGLFAGQSFAGDEWRVNDAVVRFRVKITREPNVKSAGCIVTIPDGGVLPRPQPGTTVLDERGTPLMHGCILHDPEQDLVLVIEQPAVGRFVDIYAGKATRLNAWQPDSGLTPGVLAYINQGGRNLADAHRLEKRFPPGKGVYLEILPSFALGALPGGMEGPFADYVLGYVLTKDPGRTWIAPETVNGASVEASVDGRTVNCRKEFPQRSGSTGDWHELTPGPHRVELYGYRPAMNARFLLGWRTPNAGESELGGPNPVRTGMTMWAARPIADDECMRSGAAKVVGAQFRDGAPVPVIAVDPMEYVWLDDEPLILCDIRTHPGMNPTGTTYTWQVEKAAGFGGRERLRWLFAAGRDWRITLTAASGKTSRSAVRTFHGVCSGRKQSDINMPEVQDRYNAALLDMLTSLPAGADPAIAWGPSATDLFFRLLDPIRSRPVLARLIPAHWPPMARRLDDQRRWRVEDMFFDMIAATDPDRAAALAADFEQQARRAERKQHWRLKQAEAVMYYTPDLDLAEKMVRAVAATASAAAVRARIRLADIALLRGSYDEALGLYAAAQNRVKHSDQTHSKDWRIGAIRDTAVSETTQSLISQGYYEEAAAALREWELEFPMSKLSADYLIVEAGLLMKLGDYRRAARGLVAYCKAVDVTGYLPEAMTMTLSCMIELGEPDNVLREFVDGVKTRFKYHPLGDDADGILRRLQAEKRMK